MAIQEIGDVEICGFAACVPSKIEENEHLDLFQNFGQYEKFALHTGVERRRVASEGQTASDLCLEAAEDRKSTRLNSSHVAISYAVFCLKTKIINIDKSL